MNFLTVFILALGSVLYLETEASEEGGMADYDLAENPIIL